MMPKLMLQLCLDVHEATLEVTNSRVVCRVGFAGENLEMRTQQSKGVNEWRTVMWEQPRTSLLRKGAELRKVVIAKLS